MNWQGRQTHSTIPWVFPTLEKRLGNTFERERFIEVYSEVVDEITAERERDEIEITCHERFFRAITRFAPTVDDDAHALAEELTRVHMAGVRAVTWAPRERTEAVRRIAPHYRLGLLSNFDDAQCGREVLFDSGVADQFAAVIISAEVGLRKPNARIYRRMLEMLTLDASEVLFVGDTPRDDIFGPQRIGMRTAWISNGRLAVPEGIPRPDFTIPDLSQLPHILGI
jgi:putative hydrolase of the HAD superfamily